MHVRFMLGALIFQMKRYNKRLGKAEVKMQKVTRIFWGGTLFLSFLSLSWAASGQEAGKTPEKQEQAAPKSGLDNLKAEWEAVREQQIQMIREKEDQLEKLKEEIFAKMKALNAPTAPQPVASQPASSKAPGSISLPKSAAAVPSGSSELEAQKAALQAERQKFFNEMNRQKESLRLLQSSLDKKATQLEAERESFEQAKKEAVR